MSGANKQSFGQVALAYARRGLHVFPCLPRGKEPATANGYKDATVDPALIERWWRQDADCNIGIATGARSHCFVLDVDGDDAEAVLQKLGDHCGALPPTVETITPRGRHVFFDWPSHPVRNSAGKLGPGLDIRGEGGYVVAPPSIHPSGRAYAWSVDSANTFARAPSWLLDKINGNGRNGRSATPPSVWRDLIRDGVGEGQRNDTLARLAGLLLRQRLDAVVTVEMLLAWNEARCRPPLDPDEVAAIVDNICACELQRRGCGR
jgi:hypothetical protein